MLRPLTSAPQTAKTNDAAFEGQERCDVHEPKTAALKQAMTAIPAHRNVTRDQANRRGNADNRAATTRKASNLNRAINTRTTINATKTVSVDPMTAIHQVVTNQRIRAHGPRSVDARWVILMQHSVSLHQRPLISSPRLKIRRSVRIITNRSDVI